MGLLQGEVGAVLCMIALKQQRSLTSCSMVAKRHLRDEQPWRTKVDQTKLKDAETVFTAFANSFEKSSSHWQTRDEYLSDIKQTKHQTTAELDIYIKDLIRRCQFPQEEWETCKIDLLYHATAHFEVRKFIHNAKQEDLKYDKMIMVAKSHKKTCQECQIHKQVHSMVATPHPSNYFNPLIQTSTLSKSFQKGPPKKICGQCGCSHNHGECPSHGSTCSKCDKQNYWAQQCISSRKRNSSTGHSPSPGRPQQIRQKRFSAKQFNKGRGHREGNKQQQWFTPNKKPGKGQGQGGNTYKTAALMVTEFLSGLAHPPKLTGLGNKVVSIKADLSRPAHPPKTTGE